MSLSKLIKVLRVMISGNLSASFIAKSFFWLLAVNHSSGVMMRFKQAITGEPLGLSIMHQQKLLQIYDINISCTAAMIGALSSLIHCALIGLCSFLGLRLCKLYNQGSFFTSVHAHIYAQISLLIIVYGSVGMIMMELLSELALTYDNGPGHRTLSIGAGTPNIQVIIYGLLIYLMSLIMYRGAVIQSEQALTV